MKKNSLLFNLTAGIISALVFVLCIGKAPEICYAESSAAETDTNEIQSEEIDNSVQRVDIFGKSFESKDDYLIVEKNSVETMQYGEKTLGNIVLEGDITDEFSYLGTRAFGVNSSTIGFSYVATSPVLDLDSDSEWRLYDTTDRSANNIDLKAYMRLGSIIIQTSDDGINYSNAVNPVVNYFNKYTYSPDQIFYTTDGADVAQGKYYRIIVSYKTRKKVNGGFLFFDDGYTYWRHSEEYDFYLAVNSGVISIHDLAVTKEDLAAAGDDENETTEDAMKSFTGEKSLQPQTIKDVEGDFLILSGNEYNLSILQRGETLLDGASTTKGFKIDKLGASYVVSVNGKPVDDGATFTDNGKYTITTVTKFGKIVTNTVYVFDGNNDSGMSTYFENSLINGKRVYRDGKFPTYAEGSTADVKEIDENIPALTGTIVNNDTQEVIILTSNTRSKQSYDLESGSYSADLYSGITTSGSVYHYVFNFNIIDEPAQPYVNYTNLMSADRMIDLGSKYYQVSYQTTAGGYIFACFASYDDAFSYAYEIERRFIEVKDGESYYKSKENANRKIKYFTNTTEGMMDLTEALNIYAAKNVDVGYFNPLEPFTFETFDSEDELLEDLESMSIADSIKVFPSQEEKDKFYSRRPYINDFTFIQAADYDVVSVEAFCKNDGQSYNIAFKKPVDRQLSVSSDYTITETNAYGDTRVYDVCFLSSNTTDSKWKTLYNGNESELEFYNENGVLKVSQQNGIMRGSDFMEFNEDAVYLEQISNQYDDNAIVTIKAPDVYNYEICCLVTELKDVVLYEKGDYYITFIDRIGNSYQVVFHLTGNLSEDEALEDGSVTYSEFYNSIFSDKIEN